MKSLRALCLAATIALAGAEAASAAPISVTPAAELTGASAAVEKVVLVCGPFRCFRRFGYGYGWRYGFRPYRRFGYYRPYYRRFYGFRRW